MGNALEAFILWKRTRDNEYINQLTEATDWLNTRNREQFLSLNYGWLALAAQEMGDDKMLRDSCARAMMRARKGDVFGMPMAARAMAKHLLNGADEASARRCFERAIAVANFRGSFHEHASNRLFQEEAGF